LLKPLQNRYNAGTKAEHFLELWGKRDGIGALLLTVAPDESSVALPSG